MSIDERDELEDEETADIDGLPFILHPDVISAYGSRYSIALDKDSVPVVTSLDAQVSAEKSLFCPR